MVDTVAADKTHRGHAIIEQVHADLKNSALAHLPSGKFTANAAWLVLAVIAFNLTRAAATLTGAQLAKATTATVRRKLIHVPARIASSARRITLHLPEAWPWHTAWTRLFARVADPPPRHRPDTPSRSRRDPRNRRGTPRQQGRVFPHAPPAASARDDDQRHTISPSVDRGLDRTLAPTETMVKRIAAAVAAHRDDNFVIYARADARSVESLPAGLDRAQADLFHSGMVRSRRALPMTLTEDSAIAAAAIIGESSSPKAG